MTPLTSNNHAFWQLNPRQIVHGPLNINYALPKGGRTSFSVPGADTWQVISRYTQSGKQRHTKPPKRPTSNLSYHVTITYKTLKGIGTHTISAKQPPVLTHHIPEADPVYYGSNEA
ncbi:MAG: hypothetical protein VKJ06_07065 [Vampirovibrionales bacterium]|nr:hypothetical protein [Vampirovibrionales bacterium]